MQRLLLLVGVAFVLVFTIGTVYAQVDPVSATSTFTLLQPQSESENQLSTYEIQQIGMPGGGRTDFVVGPGKVDLTLNPGESTTVNLLVSNRLGRERIFKLHTEDYVGSEKLDQTVVFLGDERGPYSLKDFITVEDPVFTLPNATRAVVPVTVSVPADAEPGGLYGSIFVSVVTNEVNTKGMAGATGGAAIVSRIAVLFLVKVPGDVEEEGGLEGFDLIPPKKVFSSGPLNFQILFKNKGSVHLAPEGEIHITNIFGEEVGFVEVERWFVLPDSLRLREVQWSREFLIGKYTAHLTIDRGYGDFKDEAKVMFYVLPWKVVVLVLGGLLLMLLIFKWIGSKFEIRKK